MIEVGGYRSQKSPHLHVILTDVISYILGQE